MPAFRLALVQLNTALGDIQHNLQAHLEWIEQAKGQGADVVMFPELSLTGYMLQDLATTVACRPDADDPIFGPLIKASHDVDLVVGFVETDERFRPHIAAAYLSRGEVLHVHRKTYLPTYGLFDEGRFFASGDQVRAFDTRFGRAGILICEEFWHVSPPYLLWMDGAELLLLVSASPMRDIASGDTFGTVKWVERINQAYASLFTTYVAHTVRVGFEDGITFGGRATVFDPSGQLVARGPDLEEGLTVVEIDTEETQRTRSHLPLLRDERLSLFHQELSRLIDRRHGGEPDAGSDEDDPTP